MKRFRSRCLLLLLLPFAFCLFTSFAARSDTSESRLAVFDDVWKTVYERYYDPEFHGVDWQHQRVTLRPLAARARNAAELYGVLRHMVSRLRDAHTRVYAPEEGFHWQHPRAISIGITLREVDGLPIVVEVERGSEAERAGLRAGDTLLSIDNELALAVFERRLKEQAGSSTRAAARLRAMATLFDGARDTIVKVNWQGSDGKEKVATLRREWRERERGLLRVRRVRENYAVIEFDAFTGKMAKDFVRALDGKLGSVRGIILDLRNNGGGEAEAMTEIASVFLPVGKSLGRFSDRTGRAAFEPHTRAAMMFAPDSIPRFSGPVVILTSERTSSAAEIFVAAMSEARRATVIGETTCGCVLAVRRRHTLPDGGELVISEMDYRTAFGARLEGAGVVPDEKIVTERRDFYARRDRAMERAIQILKVKR